MRPWFALPVALMMFASSWYIYSNQNLVESWIKNETGSVDEWDSYTLGFQQDERWLVVVVDFTDKPSRDGRDVPAASELLEGSRGFRDYHDQLRAGEGSITFDYYPTVINADHAESSYGADSSERRDAGTGTGGASGLAMEVFTKVDAQGMDWSRYDLDSDGDVDRLMILHTGGVQEDGGGPNTIWSHFGFLEEELEFNASRIGSYAMSGITSEIGTVIHEMLHSYNGVDLYAVHDESAGDPWKGVGDFDIMASGNWAQSQDGASQPVLPMAATMELMGIPRFDSLDSTGFIPGQPMNLTLTSMAEGGQAMRMRLAEGEFIWVEYRSRTNADVGLPGEGLLVSIQDLGVGNVSLNNVNRISSDPWLMVVEADRDGGLLSGANSGEASDMFAESESFGRAGVEIRNRDGVLVPWTFEVTSMSEHQMTLQLTLHATPVIEAVLENNPVELLEGERLVLQIDSTAQCLFEGLFTSSDGRTLSFGPMMLTQGANTVQGTWSADEALATQGELDGELSCDGVAQLDMRFEWNIIGNRILTEIHSDTIHWQEASQVILDLEYSGTGERTYEIEYIGPLERIVTGPHSVTLAPGDELFLQIDPQGLLSPGMYARGEIVLHDGQFEKRIEVALHAEFIDGQSSVAEWIGGPGQLLAISLGLAGLWVLLGMRVRAPAQPEPIPQNAQVAQAPLQVQNDQLRRPVDDLLEDLW